MAYFPENLMLTGTDEIKLIDRIAENPDKTLCGFDGAHSISFFPPFDISVDTQYLNGDVEEIKGLSSHVRSDTTTIFRIVQYIRSNSGNEMHRFAKVRDKNNDEYPIALFASSTLPSFLPGKLIKGNISAFAHRFEFFPTEHEAELHIKLDDEYYGPLESVRNSFYAPLDNMGAYRSLAVTTLLPIKKVQVYNIPGIKIGSNASALIVKAESRIGDVLISLPPLALKDKSAKSAKYIWCDMIISLDVEREIELDERSLLSFLASTLVFSEYKSLSTRFADNIELFKDGKLYKGKESVIETLDKTKSLSYWIEDVVLAEDFEGIEQGTPAIAYIQNERAAAYLFIDVENNKISRITIREVK